MQIFSSNGVDIAYAVSSPDGEAKQPPVLLIHGFASNHRVNWINTSWVRFLRGHGHRVIALDNRGHGASAKPHEAAAYATQIMAADASRLLHHLEIPQADVIGYSMGARIGAFLALAEPARVRKLVLGGLGIRLVQGVGLSVNIAEAMEAPALASLSDPMQRMFRAFADANKSDLVALAACIRGSRQVLGAAEAARLNLPVLVAVGTTDDVAGDAHALAALLPEAQVLDIVGRDHNRAVGDAAFKEAVLGFLAG